MVEIAARNRSLLPFQIASLAVALVAWEAVVRASPTSDFLPSPSGVSAAFIRLLGDGSLLTATSGSLGRVFLGFGIASLLGVGTGLVMGFVPRVRRGAMPIVEAMRSIAPIAWIPLAVVWFGISGGASVFIVAYAAFFPFVVNTVHGISQLDRRFIDAARTLGARPFFTVRAVVLPAIVPVVILAARISMGFAWGSVIAAEMALGVKLSGGNVEAEGLGQLMIRTLYVMRDIDALVVFLLTIGCVALVIDAGFRLTARRLVPWTNVA